MVSHVARPKSYVMAAEAARAPLTLNGHPRTCSEDPGLVWALAAELGATRAARSTDQASAEDAGPVTALEITPCDGGVCRPLGPHDKREDDTVLGLGAALAAASTAVTKGMEWAR
jgi:hypothetical protein